ncbi:MAG: pantetheine-phosphate adenylyltransferase [Candidatus Omnitrophica bacterium]|nr:pantetheine-phosphate adenylyltransferase [Candidatus Omnitrophota bacterium]
MPKETNRIAVYPGTFDPVTNGHVDLIRRGLAIFKRLVVGVAVNPGKETLFSVEERLLMVKEATRPLKGVSVKPFESLAVDFARENGARVILRGLRMLSDFEYEFQMALTNRKLRPNLETVFMMPSEESAYISSRLIKEAAALGADTGPFVPARVAERLKAKLHVS